MYRNFESLSDEKKQKIIEICLEEFAVKGYEKASTNSIVKNAGISKGALFHYFGNKKNLFLYLVDYAIEILVENYVINNSEKEDLFERLMKISLKKLELLNKYPVLNKLILTVFTDMPQELKPDIALRYDKLRAFSMPLLINNIDTGKLRKGIDQNKALETVLLALEAIGNKYIEKYKGRSQDMLNDLDDIMEDYKQYIDILKLGVYEK